MGSDTENKVKNDNFSQSKRVWNRRFLAFKWFSILLVIALYSTLLLAAFKPVEGTDYFKWFVEYGKFMFGGLAFLIGGLSLSKFAEKFK